MHFDSHKESQNDSTRISVLLMVKCLNFEGSHLVSKVQNILGIFVTLKMFILELTLFDTSLCFDSHKESWNGLTRINVIDSKMFVQTSLVSKVHKCFGIFLKLRISILGNILFGTLLCFERHKESLNGLTKISVI